MDVLPPTSIRHKLPFTYFHTNQSRPSISSPVHLSRPSVILLRTNPFPPRVRRCLAASPGPPQSNPPPQKDSVQRKDFSTLQDRIRIFFAVLFWMSLFFWSSVWDNKSNGRRPNKGSRFRR